MKYRVFEVCDCYGNPYSYGVGFKFLFWWVDCSMIGFSNRALAQQCCDRLS